jgi:hypothetical protein
MGELVRFPVPEGYAPLPSTLEEIKEGVNNVRHLFINEMTESLLGFLCQQMAAGGFDILDESHAKDFGFLIETLRSSLCTTIGLYHPFQDIAADLMLEVEPGVLEISDAAVAKFIMKEEDGPKAEVGGQEDVQA